MTNYSNDTELLDYEVLDYDTKQSNETGINESRMRLPTRYDISKYYQRLKRDSVVFRKNTRVVLDKEGNEVVLKRGQKIVRNKGEYGQWKNKAKEDIIDFSDDFNWQITYSFPDVIRDNVTDMNKEYGGRNVTYRRLYLILCERFNEKEYFVDTYFNQVYQYTMKPEIDARLDKIKKDLLEMAEYELEGAKVTASGKLDKRYKVNRGMQARLNEYEKFAQAWEDNEGIEIANLIAEDIKRCLADGRIPLKHPFNTPGTEKARIYAGLSARPVFYATSHLIDHIQLYVKIGGNRKWRTSQGILV